MAAVNHRAPVVAVREIEIDAPPETVWSVIVDINGWPAWNPDVKRVDLRGDVTEGTVFRWKAGPGTITSTLRRVERPRLLAWTGRTFGIYAIHIWLLEPRDGRTAVRTEESWEGLLVRLLRGWMQKMLEGAISRGLGHLKAEAERRAAA